MGGCLRGRRQTRGGLPMGRRTCFLEQKVRMAARPSHREQHSETNCTRPKLITTSCRI